MKKRKVLTGVLIASACLLTIGLVGQVSQNKGWLDNIGKENVEDEYIEYKFRINDSSTSDDGSLSFQFDSSFEENSVSFDTEEIKYCTISTSIDLSAVNQGINYFITNATLMANDDFYAFKFNFEDFSVAITFDHEKHAYTDMSFSGDGIGSMEPVLTNTEWTLRLYK